MLSKHNALMATLVISTLFSTAHATTFQEGTHFKKLHTATAETPDVVEFFSFYCGPCYLFNETYHIGNTISNNLPDNAKFVKYHVGAMGSLGHELTEAWSVAMVLGIQDKIEKPLFEGILKDRTINSMNDIENVFNAAGVTPEEYEKTRGSLPVKSLVYKQNEAVKTLKVTGTPAVYVSGKYLINNGGVSLSSGDSIELYPKRFSSLVNYLLLEQP
ncbi:TPA: DsbA family protein [Serratia fonticola]|jgi:thiol:disulfide interchange protein DsbA|uniref:DsbA family protein n=1 Tax=Serratia fonticola TaxID=47917 RepID=UPI00217C5D5E|nr:DsbA family protein [Serratia fonticola]CAI0831025.1 Thiol:disulfide interchange protein DsbA precursor [Serratia fonticola]CAI0993829.1 Thiol:disulfide interchange protein DsbA precursor [Serratia fonticola]CAI1573528.1 Thiol:disulfide interchange protein DsbA precursor [Serratia fonticola]CAI1645175.1 Thiol:disulfide interchange protein DsbA precursor [Serratia fonticola]CAI1706336.1 Thiol:disulfide interchange protein DsbA precursor [Serratia fonticola]